MIPSISLVETELRMASSAGKHLGVTHRFIVLLVAHTTVEYGEDGGEVEVIRIISARRADKRERRFYEEENG